MYVNKCIKCGREFETKNPRRVICPDCLYPDKKMMVGNDSTETQSSVTSQPAEQVQSYSTEDKPQFYSSYSSGGDENPRPYNRPQRAYNSQGNYNRQGGYNNNYNRQGGYSNNRPNYNRDNRQGGYNNNRPYNRDNRQQGGYNRQGGYNNNRPGGFQQRRPQGANRFNNNRRPMNNRNKAPKQLLVSREQLEQIELLYKLMLPLPNPDAHEVIGEKIGLEPRKVFFGINLVRQKMMLPKLPFPKRKLAITPDQLNAIKMLYEPLLPIPPIGCHKIIAAQLKMDEWRVHVGIGLVRAQMGLGRWNQDRPDVPEEFKNQQQEVDSTPVEKKASKTKKAAKSEEVVEETATVTIEAETEEEAPKKKRSRKTTKKAEEETPEE